MKKAGMKWVVYSVIDQLAGHWEESVKIKGTDLPPANVKGYHEKGLIPNFSHLIDNGLWVKRPWNKKQCKTVAGLKYLATGSYGREETLYNYSSTWFLEAEKEMGLFEFAKRHYLDKLTGISSNGSKRTTFILSGGALEEKYRGKTIEEVEIIDVIPTIAELLDVPYECQGKSVLHSSPKRPR